MNHPRPRPLTDDECNALVDAQGSPDVLSALQLRLANDPSGQRRVALWQHQRESLRNLHKSVLLEAIPPELVQASVKQARAAHAKFQGWRHYGGMAASLIMAFCLGWLSHTGWQGGPLFQSVSPKLAGAQMELAFVHQASVAHSVYVPEVRHPVEVGVQEQAHLVQWLSKRLGKPLKVPDLSAQGFDLVGGRLLPGDVGARAQFMFQNSAGSRITLYLGSVHPDAGGSKTETGFRYEPQAGIPSFYWVDHGFGYALTGEVPRELLTKLAEAVYQQL
jgi:anti-sigma factor RsiW